MAVFVDGIKEDGGGVVVVGERRMCNAGLQSGSWLLGVAVALALALSLKLLASTCSSTCILHSIACFEDGADSNCMHEMPISWADV